MGIHISCDMNYRAKLWKWGKSAGEVMTDLVGMCDVALGNEEDADKVFGIKAPNSGRHHRRSNSRALSICLRLPGQEIPFS